MADKIKVARTQHAVGHGGFHTGVIELMTAKYVTRKRPSQSLCYVYDCGADSRPRLNIEIAAHLSSSPEGTDVLFVSHLHSDHISGIDQLMTATPPHTVVVPYLSNADLLVWLIRDLQEGALNSLATSYAQDPERWWRDRGAQTIIFLTGEGPDEGEAPGRRPPEGGDPDPERMDGDHAESSLRFRVKIEPPDRGIDLSSFSSDHRGGDAAFALGNTEIARTVIGGTGSVINVVVDDGAGTHTGVDWLLLPYIHDVGRQARVAFQAAAAAALGWASPPSVADLLKAITDRKHWAVLRQVYRQHFGSEHNRVSMSLLSAPVHPDHDGCWGEEPFFSHWRKGWLKTGDAPFADDRYRKPFLRFYSRHLVGVGLLNLPHHGSALNFDAELVNGSMPDVAVLTTEPIRNRISNVAMTLSQVHAHGCAVRVVDADPFSAVRVTCSS